MVEPRATAPEPVDRPPPDTDLGALASLFRGPLDVRSLALTGLFVLALFFTLSVARSFFMPVVIAVILSFLLAPLVRAGQRIGIPAGVAAALVLVTVLGTAAFAAYRLAEPASAWMATAPEGLRRIEYRLRALRKPVEQVQKAAEEVESLASVEPKPQQTVTVKGASLSDTVLSQTGGFIGGAVIAVALLYFLLAAGDHFLRKLVRVLPRLADKRAAVEIVRQIESDVSTYLLTVTIINTGLGLAVGVAMYLLGVPNPVLWGVIAGVFNYVPYVGPLVVVVVLTLVGIMSFDDLGRSLVPPVVYFGINAVEAYLVTPALLGRRLSLNPVVIFLAVVFWGWLWGVGGALLAVPMLAMFKIFCDAVQPLAAVGEFLGR